MENALGDLLSQKQRKTAKIVSILVVMENALGEYFNQYGQYIISRLNPCCNGKCSWRVQLDSLKIMESMVSILVVMENALGDKLRYAICNETAASQSLL